MRLYPDAQAETTLKKWFGCVRKTYNMALDALKRRTWRKGVILNKYWLRDRFVSKRNVAKRFEYLLDTPKHIREQAVFDLYNAYKTNFAKRKKDPGHTFKIRFRSRKENQCILIPKTCIVTAEGTDKVWFFKTMMKGEIKAKPNSMKILRHLDHDARLSLDRQGRFFMCIPVTKTLPNVDTKRVTDLSRVCALDPGVRTFQTGYCAELGAAFKVADKDGTRIFRLMKHLDKLISRTDRKLGHVQRRMRPAQERMRQRIRHLVDDVHWKTIKYILDRFDIIIIPPFKTSQMSKRSDRVLTTKTVRQMTTWSHYTFRVRLQHVANQRGKTVHVLGEEYTTKTGGCCGRMHPNLGGAKVFTCRHCNVRMDRDAQAARNILLKNMPAVLTAHGIEPSDAMMLVQ